MTTRDIDNQVDYWNRVAQQKKFTIPFCFDRFEHYIEHRGRILDFGCGYGRICRELQNRGFSDIVGVDSSERMIERAQDVCPNVYFAVLKDKSLPFADRSFDAVIMSAVLTCVPTDEGQRSIINEVYRVTRSKGLLFVGDYVLQSDERNRQRYAQYHSVYDKFGVFELPEGAVMRHHEMSYVRSLLAGFTEIETVLIDVVTMNGHPAKAFQYIGQKSQ
ncbi:MAG: class I SAM-dependent methyltransferase [Armatimonadota bacterium]|nr:class I SAM-dependent methyltransferase [bacterium]